MREKRDEFFKKQYDELFEKILKVERDSYEKRDYQPPKSPINQPSSSSDINYLKDMIESISNKISTEGIARERKEHSMKQYIDSLIGGLK
jgi:hypothetical protein